MIDIFLSALEIDSAALLALAPKISNGDKVTLLVFYFDDLLDEDGAAARSDEVGVCFLVRFGVCVVAALSVGSAELSLARQSALSDPEDEPEADARVPDAATGDWPAGVLRLFGT